MDWFIETLLIVGLIFISAYSIKVNQEAIESMNAMNKQLQFMFVKSQEIKMIIEQLSKIIFEIKLMEAEFEMTPYCNKDLIASAICYKIQREETLAKNLYQIVKNYALTK